jgi:hypothetical protein
MLRECEPQSIPPVTLEETIVACSSWYVCVSERISHLSQLCINEAIKEIHIVDICNHERALNYYCSSAACYRRTSGGCAGCMLA